MGPELVSISIGAPRISLIGGTRIGTPLGGGLEQQPPMAIGAREVQLWLMRGRRVSRELLPALPN